MSAKKYVIGVDFGTLSGRALLVEAATGIELTTAVCEYADGVIDAVLPKTDTQLPPDWALQNPNDYITVLQTTIPKILQDAAVDAADVIGIGIDFTACTMLPVRKDGVALCQLPEYRANPHSWIKLWKHHAAQPQANRLNQLAETRAEPWLARYGGKISSEWMFPKIMQIIEEAPEIYEAADRIMEAADWVVWQLTGNETRNACTAGYKAIWHKRDGFPSDEFLTALHPKLAGVVAEKMAAPVPLGTRAGGLTAEMARLTGLPEGIAVAVANVDAHVSLPAVRAVEAGKMVMIMGTSTCHMVLGEWEKPVPGICGVLEDGIIPGLFGYEAGQSCVGDHFGWFVENCVPKAYTDEAEKRNMSIHDLLTEKASKLAPGESGLLALDWWNGNRSVLVDVDLTGLLIGATLSTKPEEIYRALIEATAYGTNMIIETFANAGLPIDEIIACGGLPDKNPMLMQIYADVTNRTFKIAASPQTPALGSAMFGAVAAGEAAGGYDTIFDAAAVMGKVKDTVYTPNPAAVSTYAALYNEYRLLHDYFGRGENDAMKRLKAIKANAKS